MKIGEAIDAQQISAGAYDSDSTGQDCSSSSKSAPVVDDAQPSRDLSASGADSKNSNESSTSIKRCVNITLLGLAPDGRVRICLRNDEASVWAVGDPHADLVGIALETSSRSTPMKLNNFMINRRELLFSSYGACEEISLTIYVMCASSTLRGSVDLPLGATATFQSDVDRTSLVGLSSFCLSF